MRKKGELTYRNVDILYSTYGKDEKYSAYAHVDVHFEHSITKHKILPPDKTYTTLRSAEAAIILACKQWIDNKMKEREKEPCE